MISKFDRIIPGKDENEMTKHEFPKLEPRNEEINAMIVPVKDATCTYAREKRCTMIVEVMVRIATSVNFFRLAVIYIASIRSYNI